MRQACTQHNALHGQPLNLLPSKVAFVGCRHYYMKQGSPGDNLHHVITLHTIEKLFSF